MRGETDGMLLSLGSSRDKKKYSPACPGRQKVPRASYQKLAPLGRHGGEPCLTSGVEPWTPPVDPVDLPGAVLFTTSYSNSLEAAAVARP